MVRTYALLFSAAVLGLGVAWSCGGRSPLGSLAYEQPLGAGGSGTGGLGPGGSGPGGHAGHGHGGHGVGGEGGFGGEGQGGFSPIDCMACVAQDCPDTLSCLTDPACLQGVGCVFANCLAGGEPDIMCAVDCFGGDMNAALSALMALSCIVDTCGDYCGGILPIPGG